ncbi:SRPBCC family protein [Amycolatopsis anabasis]|uniref:SRPBCC family protein n=1 Tax=Amycolatopsis anabasis TaxID=1840409 RepID=UPI00131D43AB|nr:SRPBCC family protein [Amycolatopsis anabasis]
MVEKTSSGSAMVTLPSDEEILITREFDAPRHLVYRAWTTPELVRKWWSGHRGTMTSVEIDLRVGGRWRYVLVANGGFEVAFHGEYREIVPNERIVTTEVYEMPGAEASDEAVPLNIVSFTETGGRTTLTYLVRCPNKELRDTILDSGMEVGLQEQMDLLEQIAADLRDGR